MPTIRYVLTMNDGSVKVVYTNTELENLKGQYKIIKTEKITDTGWKEIKSAQKELTPLQALYKLVSGAVMDDTKTVEECLEYQRIIEKKLKALEIIKEKSTVIDFMGLKLCNNYEEYRRWIHCKYLNCALTKEEYDLLKEILK